MTFWKFLKDKIMLLLLHLLCMLGSFFYFSVCGMTKGQLLLFYLFWMLLLSVYLFLAWRQRSRYFHGIFQVLDSLDKPFLISEVMPDSWCLEDRLYRMILRKSNKSVIDAIHHMETESTEYKEFIENWIHEVKLPLTTMNLMCDNRKASEWTAKDTALLKAHLSELENDVDKALYFARSDTVYQDYMIREISLKDVLMNVILRSKPYLIQNHVQIDMQTEADMVYCDDKWLEFMIGQIILNSVKYKKQDGCLITIRTWKDSGSTTLSIEDNGIGIRHEELGRIFDKGFTGSNGRKNRRSTGIGLYLCRKLSRKLGITLEADSGEGMFTRISLIFPDGSRHFGRE